ncbi:MAG: 50S ribosomal protein L17 [Deltaproteobacteria bacterium]|nr:50S ribosomal protein L17 [Deltaproteobacteria bacterium]
MRHRWGGRKLGRTTSHRLAMLRNMVTSLLEHEQIETTDAKAKEVRRVAERMITLGKRGDLHARRLAMRVVRTREVATKLFDELAPRYQERAGGYTRVLKVRRRVGDAAPLSLVELVDRTTSSSEAKVPARRAKAEGETKAKGRAKPKAEDDARPRGRARAGGKAHGAAGGAGKSTKQRPKV